MKAAAAAMVSATTTALLLLSILPSVHAFVSTITAAASRCQCHHPPNPNPNSATTTKLRMNIPLPTAEGGATPEEIKRAASSLSPPSSFYELQRASVRAAAMAISDGHTLLEIEFPPLPANVLEMDDVSAYDVARANVKLALDFAKSFASIGGSTSSSGSSSISGSGGSSSGRSSRDQVVVLLPDESECNIMLEDLKLDPRPYPGVLLTSLRRGEEGDTRIFKPENLFLGLMGRGSGGSVRPVDGARMYIVVVASAQELPDVEELYEQIKSDTRENDDGTSTSSSSPVIVFYNLKLDVLRGDLGAPAFPGKDFQDRFLSRVKPVYYLRTRQYSRSVSTPPFVLNYQGCLFRSYPGQYQTLLDTGTGRYRKVVGNDVRPALGTFKEQLTDALREEGTIAKKEDEGALFGFLRTGYKTTTWWEEEREEASVEWKT